VIYVKRVESGELRVKNRSFNLADSQLSTLDSQLLPPLQSANAKEP
jgi:hypothetical protein